MLNHSNTTYHHTLTNYNNVNNMCNVQLAVGDELICQYNPIENFLNFSKVGNTGFKMPIDPQGNEEFYPCVVLIGHSKVDLLDYAEI